MELIVIALVVIALGLIGGPGQQAAPSNAIRLLSERRVPGERSPEEAFAASLAKLWRAIEEPAVVDNLSTVQEMEALRRPNLQASERAQRFGVKSAVSRVLYGVCDTTRYWPEDYLHDFIFFSFRPRLVDGSVYVRDASCGTMTSPVVTFGGAQYQLSRCDERRTQNSVFAGFVLNCLEDGQWRRAMLASARLNQYVGWEMVEFDHLVLGDRIAHFVTIEAFYRAKTERYWREKRLRDLNTKAQGPKET